MPEADRPGLRWSRVLPSVVVAVAAAYYVGRNSPITVGERPLEVKCLVEAVKSQLAAAERSQIEQGLTPLFKLKDFEMEIQYVVRNSGGAKAEVVGVGTSIDSGAERVQKLRLRWDAIGELTDGTDQSLPPNQPDVTRDPKSTQSVINLSTCS